MTNSPENVAAADSSTEIGTFTVENTSLQLADSDIADLNEKVKASPPKSAIIFDCKKAVGISKHTLGELITFVRGLRKRNQQFVLLARSPLMEQLRGTEVAGNDNILIEFNPLQLESQITASAEQLNELAKAFSAATIQVVNGLTYFEVIAKEPKENLTPARSKIDVSATLEFTLDGSAGLLGFAFSEESFLSIVSAILSEPYEAINEDILDWAGEITNMVAGLGKSALNRQSVRFIGGVPKITTGPESNKVHGDNKAYVTYPFLTNDKYFFMEVSLKDSP